MRTFFSAQAFQNHILLDEGRRRTIYHNCHVNSSQVLRKEHRRRDECSQDVNAFWVRDWWQNYLNLSQWNFPWGSEIRSKQKEIFTKQIERLKRIFHLNESRGWFSSGNYVFSLFLFSFCLTLRCYTFRWQSCESLNLSLIGSLCTSSINSNNEINRFDLSTFGTAVQWKSTVKRWIAHLVSLNKFDFFLCFVDAICNGNDSETNWIECCLS